jgi:hypothetical protein
MDEPLLTWAAAKKRIHKFRNSQRDRTINTIALALLIIIVGDGLAFASFPGEQVVLAVFFIFGLAAIIYVYIDCWRLGKEPGFFCCRCSPRLFLNRTGSWKCPYCLTVDSRDSDCYAFLEPCRNCKKIPHGLRCPHCGDAFFLEQGEDERLWAEIPGGKQKPPVEPNPPKPPDVQLNPLERMEARLDLEMRKELFKAMRPREKIEALKKEYPHYPPEVWEMMLKKYDPDEMRIDIDTD